MRDGLFLKCFKTIVLIRFHVDRYLTRRYLHLKGEPLYRLGGHCNQCGACCETPAVQVHRGVFLSRSATWLIKWWHWKINGFRLIEKDRKNRVFIFKCTHFDPETKQCDSYNSRPGMCRDYPRPLLFSTNPEFFKQCGHYPVRKSAGSFRQSIENLDFPDDKKQELIRKLHLRE